MDKAKPDLMSSSGARQPAGSKRILAQLEHGARAASPTRANGWTIDGWTISLFALLLLMCGVAWVMHDKTITPKTFRHDDGSAAHRAKPTLQEDLAAPVQAAAIVNMERPAASGASDHTAAASVPPARTPARATALQQKTTTTVRAAVPNAPASGSAAQSAQTGDTDVALLTALVAHASKPAAVMPERPRDIVERQDGDSTAQLLARCKQLGLIEGMLCRSRICSGRWESDVACRAPAH